MAAWTEGEVAGAGVRLRYARSGGDKRPLVLAHGVGDDGWCWRAVAEKLTGDYDVVLVDARGHGRSTEPTDGYGPLAQADDLRRLVAELALDAPVLVGHSMGAMTVLALAATSSDLPRAIVLEDPPAWWVPRDPAADADARARMRADMAAMKRMTHHDLVVQQRRATPHWPEAEVVRWAEAKQRMSPQVVEIFDAAGGREVDWAEAVPRVRCPALLITGDPAHGALATPDAVAALRRLLPQLDSVALPDAGHSVRHDQLQRYLDALREFLANLP